MKRIQILLAGMSPMLHDIVKSTVAKQPDMEIVDHPGAADDLIRSLKETPVDVVIVGTRRPDDGTLADQLHQVSLRVKVLVIATSGRSATMYEMRPHRVVLGDVSPETLIAAIRTEQSVSREAGLLELRRLDDHGKATVDS